MKAFVILNPYANRWQALKKKGEVEEELKKADIEYDLVLTQKPNQGTEMAAEAVKNGYNPIIAAGGDGTINEVINGIILGADVAGMELLPSLGIMPLGSANDLVVNVHLPKDLKQAAQVIAAGNTRLMDLAIVNGKYFGNNSAIGLEPTITLIQEKITRIRGTPRYLLATLLGIVKNPKWNMQLEWDNGKYNGLITLVTVGNNPLTGGLFYMTPHADPFDGELTFVFGYMPTRLKILQLLPRTMKPGLGSYVENPSIHEINSTWLKIRSSTPTPLHTDGEIQSMAVQEIEYRIIPRKIPVLLNYSSKI